ncbi:splicing factor-like protein [Trichocladium antarcticum]|uniref:U4/U6 snRNA-associated-splicing factor PRP24 n=1 Tax=Trichocladium antarcticum TaxID=1450529 RepID=A0AAN6UJQ2_9PEZI|nr:splicing factor-like protein [Trichocladium antarcticum]
MANPVGEDNWVDYVDQQQREAADLEGRVRVVESFRRATQAEPGSLKVWMAYCEYFWSLYTDCQLASDAGWPPEEQQIGRETFTLDAALNLWQEGYGAVQYRLSDSHHLWNRWVSLEMELLRRTATEAGVRRITHLFKNRLVVPHATWDATAQMFSSFLSEYNRQAYEGEMEQATRNGRDAKRLYDLRDPWEAKLAAAVESRDPAAVRVTMTEYLDWEIRQVKTRKDRKDIVANFQICLGLFSRALTGALASDEGAWLNFSVLISTTHTDLKAGRSHVPASLVPNMLDGLQRAVRHTPWAGPMWARYILTAEEVGLSFTDIERIKHAATDSAQLDRDGMTGVLDMYSAWCGYLKRTAMNPNSTEEAIDVAEVGLPSALEDVRHWGKRKYGEAYQGDPDYRLEKILIQFLTERKDDIEGARAVWEELSRVELHANSYDFWLHWYLWEMVVFGRSRSKTRSPTPVTLGQGLRVPTHATRVFNRALKVRTLDWPERVMEIYLRHCNDYEPPEVLREAQDTIYKTRKGVAKRREREAAQATQAARAAHQQAAQAMKPADQAVTDAAEPGSSPAKRKREAAPGEDESGNKRAKGEPNGDELKRDRENTSVFVMNLPSDVTQTKMKQFFREYGHINNMDIQRRNDEAVALVEFRNPEDARSALLRDGKYYNDSVVRVTAATDCTLFVTNYPADADEHYLRRLFQDCGEIHSIRFPSLKYNTKRRFCYVTFRDRGAAAAATGMDGTPLEHGKFKLMAKFSDPVGRQQRHGAQAEERELHIVNLPRGATEEDVQGLFAKAGRVASVRVPRNMAGNSHGTAFVVMETKDEAREAITTLDKLIFGNHPIKVELSRPPASKITATSRGGAADGTPETGSPSPSVASTSGPAKGPPSRDEIAARTVAVLGIPDTMNDARVRAALVAAGVARESIVKLVLHPGHGGAVVELADAAAAGKAALAIDGTSVEGGGALWTGSVPELFRRRADRQVDRIDRGPHPPPKKSLGGDAAVGAKERGGEGPARERKETELMPPPPMLVRRPVPGRTGPKRGLGFVGAAAKKVVEANGPGAAGQGKSNADFKKMFLGLGGGAPAAATVPAGKDGEGQGKDAAGNGS